MIHATCAELGAHLVCGSQTKVGDGESEAVVEAENVLRLQVAVIDIQRMAIVYCVEQLKENLPNQVVLTKISAVVQDLREEITVAAVVHDDPCVLLVFNDAMKGHNSWMCRGQLMKSDLTDVQLPLASCAPLVRMRETFHCVRGGVGRIGVDSAIHDAVAAITEDFDEFQRAVVDDGANRRGGGRGGCLCAGHHGG